MLLFLTSRALDDFSLWSKNYMGIWAGLAAHGVLPPSVYIHGVGVSETKEWGDAHGSAGVARHLFVLHSTGA